MPDSRETRTPVDDSGICSVGGVAGSERCSAARTGKDSALILDELPRPKISDLERLPEANNRCLWCLRCPGGQQHVVVLDMPNTCAVTIAKSEEMLEDGEPAETTMSQNLNNDGTVTYVTGIKFQLRERAGRPVDWG